MEEKMRYEKVPVLNKVSFVLHVKQKPMQDILHCCPVKIPQEEQQTVKLRRVAFGSRYPAIVIHRNVCKRN